MSICNRLNLLSSCDIELCRTYILAYKAYIKQLPPNPLIKFIYNIYIFTIWMDYCRKDKYFRALHQYLLDYELNSSIMLRHLFGFDYRFNSYHIYISPLNMLHIDTIYILCMYVYTYGYIICIIIYLAKWVC